MKRYDNFTECYYDLVDRIYNHHEFESAPRGMKIRESLGVTFEITNPRNRLLHVPERDFSLCYCTAEIIWYLIGNNETSWIANYSSFWKNISDDRETANSAYGYRIFTDQKNAVTYKGDLVSQWEYVKRELSNDPDSRRAVIHIRVPEDGQYELDVPCTLSMQFFIRDGKLHMLVTKRSTDLVLGLSYDLPAFTIFQELLAKELGVELGVYRHISNSLHIYERHFSMCEQILENAKKNKWYIDPTRSDCQIEFFPPDMPAIPEGGWSWVMSAKRLNHVQGLARQCTSVKCLPNDQLANMVLEEYWNDWGKILLAHRAGKLGDETRRAELIKSTTFEGYHDFTK